MTDQPPSVICKPVRKYANIQRGTTVLEFDETGQHPLNGEYFIRGGICWPVILILGEGLPRGYGVLVGENVTTKKSVVLDDQEFVTIENVLDDNGKVMELGASTFLNRCWSDYFCDTFHIVQMDNIHRPHMLDVMRSEMVKPKPHFIIVQGEAPETVERKVWENLGIKRLAYKRDGRIAEVIQQRPSQRGAPVGPELIALGAALAGMDLYPWRPRKVS
jgi:hypothetical protein